MPPTPVKFDLQSNDPFDDGTERALTLFRQAAKHIPAYKDFLNKNGVDPVNIRSINDFSSVPLTDKANYISQYSIDDLCWEGKLTNLNYIVSSSGSTGEPYYWPRGVMQDEISALIYLEIFRDIFNLDDQPTILLNSYGQGSWIAGTELYNSARYISQSFPNFTVINSGVDPELIVSQIKKMTGLYKKIIICGYPPFLKDVIELGSNKDIDWQKLDVYLVGAGEGISSSWRTYVLDLLNSNSGTNIVNLYGLADAGVVAGETPATLAIKHMHETKNANLPEYLGGEQTMSLLQYHPNLRYFESDDDNRIILTTYAGIPLIRYDTKDRGGLISSDNLIVKLKTDSSDNTGLITQVGNWQTPFMYLYGRRDLSITFYAVNIYPENIRNILESKLVTKKITGRFIMEIIQDAKFDQQLQIAVELAPDTNISDSEQEGLRAYVVTNLRKLNSEYNELYSKLGQKIAPNLLFKEFGAIGYIQGKKHRWVKHD